MHSANKNCIIAQESIYHFFHILARRKTSKPALSPIVFIYCNPRSREGSDQVLPCWCIGRITGFNPRSREGSDESARVCYTVETRFNPRSREGSDLLVGKRYRSIGWFQSTLPRGERQNLFFAVKSIDRFNPRSREGSD